MAPTTLKLAAGAAAAALILATSCSGKSSTTAASPSPSPSPSCLQLCFPQIHVTVNGDKMQVAEGATVGDIASRLAIKLRPADYVDVAGVVITPHLYPAKLLVAGKRATKATVVAAGESVSITPGKEHVEDTTTSKQAVSGQVPLNPQYNLATAPGEYVIERGKESNKIASVTFHPTGKASTPKEVALTFDDGPNPPYTNKILKILHQHNVPATFFLIGYEAQKYPGLVRQEVHDGMTIGDHSWSHPLGFASLDQGELQNQVGRAYDELKTLGVTPFLFRPPGGSFDGDVVETARRLGMRSVIWTTDTHDYVPGRQSKDITKYVLKTVHPGSIVLMHDGGGDRSATVKALPDIIKGLRKKGYTLTAIPRAGWEPGPGATPLPESKSTAKPSAEPTSKSNPKTGGI